MQLSYEDQLHVWRLLLTNKLAGKIAPAHPWDRRPTEYALLVPDALAVGEVNAVSDIPPITVKHLPSILARFRHLDPPYSSFDDEAKEHNAKNRKVVAAPASAYGYELVNGVPRWTNGRLRDCRSTETGDAPWLSQGVSRATWYRRQRETREAPNSI